MRVEGETAYCVDINTGFKNGYKTRHDASASMSAAQIEDVALSLEYVKQYRSSHSNLNANQGYLLEQCVVWQRLSEYLGWQCDNVRAAYSEISQDIQNEVYTGARAFVQANKGRYKCGGYIYTGEGQDLGQFWAELNVGNAKVKKTTANESITKANAMYSIAGATFGIFSDQNCSNQIGTLTTNENGETNEVEVTAGTVYIKELSAPKGYKLDTTVHSLKVEAGKTAVLNVSDVPKVTETLVDLFKIDMETGKATAQGDAALAGAEFTWHYYDGLYTKDNLPEKATRTWVTKTVVEKDNNGNIHYVTKLTGVKLFEGLLLGGEVVYETPKEKEEKERQDLQLEIPWYQVGSGTKTYMVGLLDHSKQKTQVENEDLPTILWRNGIKGGSVFCIVGDYMKDSTALGLLNGMITEASEYYIYPVVNAQNLSMINFPAFADENDEEMMKLYSQSVTGMTRDIMWPSLVSIVEKGKLKMTCFMQPQADYEDGIEPDTKDMIFYLKQMKEQEAEVGLSLEYKNAGSLREKLDQDADFFQKSDSSYKYGAAFAEERDLDTITGLMNTELLKNVSTLVCEYTEKEPVVSYCTDSVTLQSVTSDGMNYSYR